MFINLTLAVELIALAFGVALLIWAYRNNGVGIVITKVFGYIITILSVFILVCTLYCAVMHGMRGYYAKPSPHMLMKQRMMHHHYMKKMMMDQRKKM